MALISVEKLCFSYDSLFGLCDINFKVEMGEIATLLGPNGSGKTTLLKCIYGILKPKMGCIYLNNRSLFDLKQSELAKNVGGVPQIHHPTFPFKTIDVVVMGRTPYINIFSSPSKNDYQTARKIIRDLEILHLEERPYTKLSGGEQQLVFIARALLQNPKVLLLDEPVAHLDIKNRAKVLRSVKKVAKEMRIAVLMTLHDPNDAIIFSNKIGLIKEGKLIEYGYPDEVINEQNLQKVYNIHLTVLEKNNRKVVVYMN